MLRLLVDVLLPVALVAGCGWLLSAAVAVEVRSLNRAVFYLFAPSLVFRILVEHGGDGAALARVAGFAVAALAAPALVAWAACRALGWNRSRTAAVVLVTLLPNAGNLGLPLTRFAFGDEALAHAGVFFVASSVVTYTAGVFVASVGRASWRTALGRLPRVPAIWAVAVAAVLVATGTSLPAPAMRAVDLLADATIPTFLLVLGMQLRAGRVREAGAPAALGATLRLVGGAVAGLALAPAFGLDGVARQAAVLEAATPSAVASIMLAVEFDLEPALVTSVVVITTLAGPLTLLPVLALLGA